MNGQGRERSSTHSESPDSTSPWLLGKGTAVEGRYLPCCASLSKEADQDYSNVILEMGLLLLIMAQIC